MSALRVVVTGGAGFIGANTVRALRADPGVGRIVVVDDLSSGSAANLAGIDGVALLEGSILDENLLVTAFADADAVIHLAARPSVPGSVAEPVATHAVNATGTVLVLEAARHAGGCHVVLGSSSAVYGDDPTPNKHEGLPPRPLSPYAADKLASEASAAAYTASYAMPTLAFRFFNVFGPLQPPDHPYAAVVPSFTAAALAGRPLLIHGDGHQTRDFVYVGDVARLLVTAVTRRIAATGPVNLATGTSRTLLDVITALETILGHPLERIHGDPRPGDVRHSSADQHRLHTLFGDLHPTPFPRALATTSTWLRGHARATTGS